MRKLKDRFATTDDNEKNVPLALKRIQKKETHTLLS